VVALAVLGVTVLVVAAPFMVWLLYLVIAPLGGVRY
jgi:hypothetical protein